MSYLLLIIETAGERNSRPLALGREAMAKMLSYAEDLQSRGVLVACDALKSDADGVRLRRREGQATRVDGPFTEAKEMIGGFFLLNCATREQAVELAGLCPAIDWATIEVREIGPCYE